MLQNEPLIITDEGRKVTLSFNQSYPKNPNQRAITGFTDDGELWACYTVYIEAAFFESDRETIIDTNGAPHIVDVLVEAGIIKDTDKRVQSGYCTYPIVRLTDKALAAVEQVEIE